MYGAIIMAHGTENLRNTLTCPILLAERLSTFLNSAASCILNSNFSFDSVGQSDTARQDMEPSLTDKKSAGEYVLGAAVVFLLLLSSHSSRSAHLPPLSQIGARVLTITLGNPCRIWQVEKVPFKLPGLAG